VAVLLQPSREHTASADIYHTVPFAHP